MLCEKNAIVCTLFSNAHRRIIEYKCFVTFNERRFNEICEKCVCVASLSRQNHCIIYVCLQIALAWFELRLVRCVGVKRRNKDSVKQIGIIHRYVWWRSIYIFLILFLELCEIPMKQIERKILCECFFLSQSPPFEK